MAANSKMSQILNWAENFLSANANAARDLVVNPIVDLWSYAAKWYARWWAMLLWKDPDKAAAAVDKVADILKTGWGYNAKQEVDPTSIAWAVGDWLIRWVDQAVAVLTLTEAAKQLPKAAQKWRNKILNKVKDAKSKSQQMKLAKEAREYINSYADDAVEVDQKLRWEVPSYQQRRYAEFRNLNTKPLDNWVMESYRWVKSEPAWAMKTLDNITNDFAKTKDPISRWVAVDEALNPDAYRVWVYWRNSWIPRNVVNTLDKPYPVNATTTSDANWLRWQQYRKWASWKYSPQQARDISAYRSKGSQWYTPSEIRAMEKEMAEDVWSSAASKAAQEPDIFAEALLEEQTAQAKDLWTTVDKLKELAYSNNMTTREYYDMIKKAWKEWWEQYLKNGEIGEKFKQAVKNNKAKEKAFLKQVEAEALADAEAEARSIAAGERAYKHEWVDPTIWF